MRNLKEEKVLAETLSSSCSVCHALNNSGAVFLLLESEVSACVVRVALMSQGDIVVASMVTMVLCCNSKKQSVLDLFVAPKTRKTQTIPSFIFQKRIQHHI